MTPAERDLLAELEATARSGNLEKQHAILDQLAEHRARYPKSRERRLEDLLRKTLPYLKSYLPKRFLVLVHNELNDKRP